MYVCMYKSIVPVQPTTSRIVGNLARLIITFAIYNDHIYIYTRPVLSNMPTLYQQWVWARKAHIKWSMVTCQGSTLLELPQVEVYWPCAGGLTAVNAIGTQLRDPINSGLT